ncbi:hypothetical protein D3C87_1752660 [compost metagenome]
MSITLRNKIGTRLGGIIGISALNGHPFIIREIGTVTVNLVTGCDNYFRYLVLVNTANLQQIICTFYICFKSLPGDLVG